MLRARALVLLLLAALSARAVIGKKYKAGELIPVYANKIGPFQNPTETYRFYTLPFCEPNGGAKDKLEDLGEVTCPDGPCMGLSVIHEEPGCLFPGS